MVLALLVIGQHAPSASSRIRRINEHRQTPSA
jgi:hypothetical protein